MGQSWRWFKRLSLRAKIVAGLVVLALLNGIIEGVGQAGFFWLVARVAKGVGLPAWQLALLLIVLILVGSALTAVVAYIARLKSQVLMMKAVAVLDDELLEFLDECSKRENHANLDKLLEEFLEKSLMQAAKVVTEIHRGSILREVDGYLEPWVCSPHGCHNLRLYVGGDSQRRSEGGSAGEMYRRRLRGPLVVHMAKANGQWQADDASFVPTRSITEDPPYRSFILLTLLDSNRRRLGVLCLDSMDESIFDLKDTQDLLEHLAKRVVAGIVLYHDLRRGGTPRGEESQAPAARSQPPAGRHQPPGVRRQNPGGRRR